MAATNSQSETPKPKSRRRWFRFSLGTLFVCLTIACVSLGWIANRAQRQRQAVEMVKSLNGYVRYDWQTPPKPTWLRERLGVDYFDDVVSIDLGEKRLRTRRDSIDSDLAALRGLPKLRDVILVGPQIGDDGCRHLATLPALESLSLVGTKVTDVGLRSLSRVNTLKELRLENCRITSDGFVPLAGHDNLETLDLYDTQVADAGIEHLTMIPHLRELCIGQTSVSDAGIRQLASLRLTRISFDMSCVTVAGVSHLRGHPTLNEVWIAGSALNDEGIAHLATIPNLSVLWLQNTGITEECIPHLERCKKLTHLEGVDLSPGAINRLQKSLPSCSIQ